MTSLSTILGTRTEKRAERWLKKQGLKIIHRNYKCKHGEIDLIAQSGNALVFVEVRYRKGGGFFGDAVDSVTKKKQQRIVRAATNFLLRHTRYEARACRFDVLAYHGDNNNPEWIIGAFN